MFLLSPANTGGKRCKMLFRQQAEFDIAVRLRQGTATIGEVYTFISGLYFRGKMAYISTFGQGLVIVPGLGLLPPQEPVTAEQLRGIACIDVHENNEAYSAPLQRDATLLAEMADEFVLLGSIATEKYTRPLLELFGQRLLFPAEFVGRGDMSRGGLMLRAARSGAELTYVPVQGAVRHGRRPPKLS